MIALFFRAEPQLTERLEEAMIVETTILLL